jgi:putative ABC transport system permease protein
MRTHKFDGWLLARLAAQNLSRRRLRVFLLALSVAMAVGVGLASLVLGWAIRDGISTDFSRMGADMIVVPRDTLVNITSSLLTVQPTDESMESALAGKLAKIPGVERVAPQRLVSAMVEGQQYKLIAFDPRVDFTVGSWQASHGSGVLAATALLAGGSLAGQTGETLSVCGQPMRIYGRLSKTGVGPFDESYFVTFDVLDRLARTTFRTKKPSLTKGANTSTALAWRRWPSSRRTAWTACLVTSRAASRHSYCGSHPMQNRERSSLRSLSIVG